MRISNPPVPGQHELNAGTKKTLWLTTMVMPVRSGCSWCGICRCSAS